MDYGTLTLEEMKNGYHQDPSQKAYVCHYCGELFPEEQVFPVGDGFFTAEAAVVRHVEQTHEGSFEQLLNSQSKYNTLTDTQKELLALFHDGVSDKDVAAKMGVSPSTVRHQKFTFREKAKRAKMYLAIYEKAFEQKHNDGSDIIPIHDSATMVDSRYVTTEKERDKILKSAFRSFDPLLLEAFPFKPKKHLVVLTRIAQEFEAGRKYTEVEMKEILQPIYEDHSLLRRLLVDYGFMDRTDDGKKYWVK